MEFCGEWKLALINQIRSLESGNVRQVKKIEARVKKCPKSTLMSADSVRLWPHIKISGPPFAFPSGAVPMTSILRIHFKIRNMVQVVQQNNLGRSADLKVFLAMIIANLRRGDRA